MIAILENYKPKLYYTKVSWISPDEGWILCNMDRASKENPDISAYECCLRDKEKNLVYVEARNLGVCTNMEAESIAIEKALRYYFAQNYHKVVLQTNSLSLRNMIIGEWSSPWELVERIEEIQHLLSKMTI